MKRVLLLLTPLFLLSACGGGDKKTTSKTVTVVHGDPIVVAKNTYTNTDLPDLEEFEKYFLNARHLDYSIFKNKSKKNISVNKASEKTLNAHHKHNEHSEHDEKAFSFEVSEDKTQLKISIDPENKRFLHFSVSNTGKLAYSGYGTENLIFDFLEKDQIIHFSLHQTTKSFSLLHYYSFNYKSEDVQTLINYTFQSSEPQRVTNVNKVSHKFITKNKARWKDKDITINGCGLDNSISSNYERAASDWSKTGIVKVNYFNLNNYPPFSDLNTHCVYKIDRYLKTHKKEIVFASTYTSANEDFIFDADIFVLSKELQKMNTDYFDYSSKEIKTEAKLTATHEIGHALGLGHKFVKNKYASIMNYGQDSYKGLTKYDINTLAELYKDTGINP